jgi:hypothetical protein
MPPFTAAQIVDRRHEGIAADRCLYTIKLPNVSYDGTVVVTGIRASAPGTEQWIADRLNARAVAQSVGVVTGQLYSKLDLTTDETA